MSDLSRRSILKSSAWAVPAVTVAVASPAFATSGAPEPKQPEVSVLCIDGPGKKVRLIVRLQPEPKRPALVVIGTQVARYDKNIGYYIDVLSRPKRALSVAVTYHDHNNRLRVIINKFTFDCSKCKNGR